MLETALVRSGKLRHDLFRSLHARPQILFLSGVLGEEGHCQIRRRRVDVQRREADTDLSVVEACEHLQIALLLLVAEQLPQPVKPDALRPLPILVTGNVVPRKVVVLHILQKGIIRLVKNVGEGVDHLIHLIRDRLDQLTLPAAFLLQFPNQRLQLLRRPDRVIRLPVRLLHRVKISRRPVQPDGGNPVAVCPGNILL